MSEQQVQALLVRALKTFIQGFLGYLTTAIGALGQTFGSAALWALLAGGIAAGVSALMNVYLKPVEAK